MENYRIDKNNNIELFVPNASNDEIFEMNKVVISKNCKMEDLKEIIDALDQFMVAADLYISERLSFKRYKTAEEQFDKVLEKYKSYIVEPEKNDTFRFEK